MQSPNDVPPPQQGSGCRPLLAGLIFAFVGGWIGNLLAGDVKPGHHNPAGAEAAALGFLIPVAAGAVVGFIIGVILGR